MENLRRASKESSTVIKPGENKRGNESFGGFKKEKKKKILSDLTDPPDLQVCKVAQFVHLFLQCGKLDVKNDTKVTSCIAKWDVTVTHT